MSRIRAAFRIEGHQVSPDSIKATNEYLTDHLVSLAEVQSLALDWNSWRSRSMHHVNGDLELVQWASVIA